VQLNWSLHGDTEVYAVWCWSINRLLLKLAQTYQSLCIDTSKVMKADIEIYAELYWS